MVASRPGNRVREMRAPSGIPITAAQTTALRLTTSDSRTIANNVGSALKMSWRAEALSGIAAVAQIVLFRSISVIYACLRMPESAEGARGDAPLSVSGDCRGGRRTRRETGPRYIRRA